MEYLIETHLHTKMVSRCGQVSIKDTINIYEQYKYDAIFITDHYSKDFFDSLGGSHKDKIDVYLSGYRTFKEVAINTNLKIYLGLELRFDNANTDFLIYGVTEEFLYNNEDLFNMNQESFFKLANENNLAVIVAHPFRSGCVPPNPNFIHGVEVLNGNARQCNNDLLAKLFAKTNNLTEISGSDFHRIEDISEGVMTEKLPENSKDFAQMILNREVKPSSINLKTTDELQCCDDDF